MSNLFFLLFLQIYVNHFNTMLVLFFSIVFATAAGVTAFLLISSGNLNKFRETFTTKPLPKAFPILTPSGEVLESKEELEAQLDILKHRLDIKKSELEISKTKVNTAAENMEKLMSTSVEVRKYYMKLKAEITRSERDCKELQKQIEDFKKQQKDLKNHLSGSQSIWSQCSSLSRLTSKSASSVNLAT